MGLVSGQVKRLESAISICLIAVLLLIALTVFLKQSNYDLSRFGLDTPIADFKKPIQLAPLIPDRFEPLSNIEVYNPENLYEKIDGKATFYIESGFIKLYTQRFISKQDQNLWMEIFVYDMDNIKNAFSVYSQQRRPDANMLPYPKFAYRTTNAIFFVHGKYYVELIGSSPSNQLFDAMLAVARNITQDTTRHSPHKLAIDETAHISEISLFPQENIIPGSVKLYLSNAFGFEGLVDTFTCQYKLDNQILTAFLSKRPHPQDAHRIAENYCNFLIDNGGVLKSPTHKTLKTIKARIIDFYGATEIVFTVGPFVAGIHEAENQKFAQTLALMLINKLSEATKYIFNTPR